MPRGAIPWRTARSQSWKRPEPPSQWCDHLAHLIEIRDGIQLQALAGVNPRDEFHRIALRESPGFALAYDRAADIDSEVIPAQLEQDITVLEPRPPAATWTYMTNDNPLGNPMDRAARAAGNGRGAASTGSKSPGETDHSARVSARTAG